MADDSMPCFDQSPRHATAHHSETDKADDRRKCLLLQIRALPTPKDPSVQGDFDERREPGEKLQRSKGLG